MSLILDALRRRRREESEQTGDHVEEGRDDAVLATLGYGRSRRPRWPSLKAILLYCASAIAIGFVSLALFLLLTTSPPQAASTAQARVTPPAAARPTAPKPRPRATPTAA